MSSSSCDRVGLWRGAYRRSIARHNAYSFSKGNEFSQRLDLHCFHHPVAMRFDGASP